MTRKAAMFPKSNDRKRLHTHKEPCWFLKSFDIFRFRAVFEQTLVLRFHCGSHLLKKSGDWKIDTFTSTYIHTLSVWEKCSGSWKLHSSNFLMIDTSMVGIIENMTPFGKINVCFLLPHEAVYISMKLLASPRLVSST